MVPTYETPDSGNTSKMVHVPKITSPNGAVSHSISNFESLKNSNSGRNKDILGPRRPHHIINTNLRDRSLDLKMNYGGLKAIDGLKPPVVPQPHQVSQSTKPPPIGAGKYNPYISGNINSQLNGHMNASGSHKKPKDTSPPATYDRD